MLTSQAKEALSSLTTALAGSPELADALRERWRGASPWLPAAVKSAADTLGAELGALTIADGGIFGGPLGDWVAEDPVLMAWCEASAWRRDVALAPVLTAAKAAGADVTAIARARVVQGPLRDALSCAPLLGDGAALASPENVEARARLEILVWEAGASAQSVPELAPWLWGSHATFDAMIGAPARGTLRGRVLAARCLEVTVDGLPPDADQELDGGTLDGKTPQYAPETLLRSGLVYRWKERTKVALLGTFLSDHYATDDEDPTRKIPAYMTWDLTAEVRVYRDWLSVVGGINNLFDEDYYARIRGDGIDPAYGRNYYAGIQFAF